MLYFLLLSSLCVRAQAVEPSAMNVLDISSSPLNDKEGAKDVRTATCDRHASDSLMRATSSLLSG